MDLNVVLVCREKKMKMFAVKKQIKELGIAPSVVLCAYTMFCTHHDPTS
jgi:hypothetical protein